MRFTVHRPPDGEVSLCWYRPSGGDVAGCVHVGVLHGPGLPRQATHAKTAWLLRLSRATCPHAEHRCDVYAAATRSSLPAVLWSSRRNQPTPPLMTDGAVEPPFLRYPSARVFHCAARGAGHRPHVERLDPNGVKPARQIRCRLLHPVSPPIGFARFDSGDRRASSAAGGWSHARRAQDVAATGATGPARRGLRPGQCNSSPVDRAADTATPRSTPTTLPSAGPGIESGMCANATCQRPARSRAMR